MGDLLSLAHPAVGVHEDAASYCRASPSYALDRAYGEKRDADDMRRETKASLRESVAIPPRLKSKAGGPMDKTFRGLVKATAFVEVVL